MKILESWGSWTPFSDGVFRHPCVLSGRVMAAWCSLIVRSMSWRPPFSEWRGEVTKHIKMRLWNVPVSLVIWYYYCAVIIFWQQWKEKNVRSRAHISCSCSCTQCNFVCTCSAWSGANPPVSVGPCKWFNKVKNTCFKWIKSSICT